MVLRESSPFGYGAVAACMSSDRDLALYRRFGALNARNLLYLQSELMSLEIRLQELDESANDVSKGTETWSSPRSWYYLEKQGGEHLEVVEKIRGKLEEYSKSGDSLTALSTYRDWRFYMGPCCRIAGGAALSRKEAIRPDLTRTDAYYTSPDLSKTQPSHHMPGYST